MPVLSDGELVSLCAGVGFANVPGSYQGHGLTWAVAVILAESGGDTSAISPPNDDEWGSIDRGLWQWNSHWHSEVTDACAYNALCATEKAFGPAGTDGGRDFGQWSSVHNGQAASYLDRAQAAVDGTPYTGGLGDGGGSLGSPGRPCVPGATTTNWLDGFEFEVTLVGGGYAKNTSYELDYRDGDGFAVDDEDLDAQVWAKALGGVNVHPPAVLEHTGGPPLAAYGAYLTGFDWGWDPTVPPCWHPDPVTFGTFYEDAAYPDEGWVGYQNASGTSLVAGVGLYHGETWAHGQGHYVANVFRLPIPGPPGFGGLPYEWEQTIPNPYDLGRPFPLVAVEAVDVLPVVFPGSEFVGDPTVIFCRDENPFEQAQFPIVDDTIIVPCDTRAVYDNGVDPPFDYPWWYHDVPGGEVATLTAGSAAGSTVAGPFPWWIEGGRIWFFGYEATQFGDYPGHVSRRASGFVLQMTLRIRTPRYRYTGVTPGGGGGGVPPPETVSAQGLFERGTARFRPRAMLNLGATGRPIEVVHPPASDETISVTGVRGHAGFS